MSASPGVIGPPTGSPRPGCLRFAPGAATSVMLVALMPLPQPLFQVFPVDDPEDQDHFVGVIDLIYESIVTHTQTQERILAALDCLD